MHEKCPKSEDLRQNNGAAGQIRTADLILTNYRLACYSLRLLAVVFAEKSSVSNALQILLVIACCSLLWLYLNPFCLLLNPLLNPFGRVEGCRGETQQRGESMARRDGQAEKSGTGGESGTALFYASFAVSSWACRASRTA